MLTNTRFLDPIYDAWGKLQPLKMCGVPLLFLERIRFNYAEFWCCIEITVFSLLTLFYQEILGHDAFLSLDPIFVGLGNSP